MEVVTLLPFRGTIMGHLDPESDRAVQAAVDAYLDGRLHPAIESSVAFETQNSRYGVTDGAISYASVDGLAGARLVGWLIGSGDRAAISAWWREGARAVLIDRRHGRHVIVTSPTRAYRSLTQASGAVSSHPEWAARSEPASRPPTARPRPLPSSVPVESPLARIHYSTPPPPHEPATTSTEPPPANTQSPVIPPAPRPARFPAPDER
jgi:hypothetical protein